MVKVKVGSQELYIDQNLKDNLDEVIKVVTTKDFDYVSIIAGTPGIGKSTFTQTLAKYCCPWFDENHIAFTDESFIRITNECKPFSSVILDESFQSLNTKASMTSEFMRIINHLQIIRQKNLFLFLCLPNYFDLAKGVAIYRSHHLFVCYSPEYGTRGYFAAYSRDAKKNLYINGKKFMNYNATKPNFRGRFTKQRVLDWDKYEKNKTIYLHQQSIVENLRKNLVRNKLIKYLNVKHKLSSQELAELTGLALRTIQNLLKTTEEDFKSKNKI